MRPVTGQVPSRSSVRRTAAPAAASAASTSGSGSVVPLYWVRSRSAPGALHRGEGARRLEVFEPWWPTCRMSARSAAVVIEQVRLDGARALGGIGGAGRSRRRR